MEVALPVAASMDCYEDMFKEITRKLYGEEGLPENMGEGGENGQPMRCPPEYDNEGDGHGGTLTAFGLAALMQNGFPPHPGMLRMDHLQEAKYRGSLQHGNPLLSTSSSADDKWIPSDEILQWTVSRIASYNPAQKLFRCADCECVGFLSRVAEHWLGTHANLRVFQCPQCPYSSAWARCVRMHLTRQHNVTEPPNDSVTSLYKENPVLEEVTKFLQRLKAKVERDTSTATAQQSKTPTPKQQFQTPSPTTRTTTSTPSNSENTTKRYCCSYCPYATDRRDLFTRHENIHRELKPFQCYVCEKQFNRADHVKKHFLRMHRDYPYDLNRIRRQPPKNASGMSYYHKYNNNPATPSSNNNRQENNPHEGAAPSGNGMHQVPHHLNIPGGFSSNLGARMPGNVQQQKLKTNHNGCNAKSHGSKTKKKGDKRYSCCYCAWSGVDNWCLKRHLNTHLKPFVCGLCDYKAARSERLATHVLKVHNKKACSRCSFMADDQAQLAIHLQEHHPLDHRNIRTSNSGPRNVAFSSHPTPMASMATQAFGSQHGSHSSTSGGPVMNHQHLGVKREHYDYDMFHQLHRPFIPSYKSKQQYGGAERLFHYMEVSDTSETEENDQDFSEPVLEDEEEPPPFICRVCGCEFVDDNSLETHHFTHHRFKSNTCDIKEIEPNYNMTQYQCTVCEKNLLSQVAMMEHMRSHSGLSYYCRAGNCTFTSSTVDTLHEHIVTVHKEMSCVFKCPHCGLTVTVGIEMESHLLQHHAPDVGCTLCEANGRNWLGGKENNSNNRHFGNRVCNTGLDSNMNLNSISNDTDDQSSSDGMSGKRSRKQRQPRKVISDVSDLEIQVNRHPGSTRRYRRGRKRRISSVGMTQLRDKYTGIILTRRRLKCNWCRQEMATFPYHTSVSLALHQLWRHTGTKFQCEHCDKCFRHQYQVILHASREHVIQSHTQTSTHSTQLITTVPDSIKEPINLLNTPVPGKLQHPFFNSNNLCVPDIHNLSNSKIIAHSNEHHSHFTRLDAFLPLPMSMPPSLYQQFPLLPPSSSMT